MFDKLTRLYFAPDYDDPAGADTETVDNEYDDAASTAEAKSDDDEVDREELEKKVGERLDAVFSEDDGADQDDAADTTVEDEDESDEADDSEEGSDKKDDSEEAEDDAEEDNEEAAAEDEHEQPSDAPTLPDAHRRSLYAYGWKDDEINQNLRAMGDSFLKTAERIHENRNTELQQWAQAGRQAREQDGTDEGQQGSGGSEQQPAAQSGKQADTPQGLQPVDAAKLKEQYGEDELIDQIVGPVNETIKQVNAILPQLQQGQQAAQQAEIDRVSREVDQFFSKEELQPYKELYGDSSAGLTDQQLELRNKVLDTAYDLMIGASTLRGQNMPLNDALEYAHEIAAKDTKETAVRKSVKKQAKQRNRGLSQKPSRKKGSGSGGSDNGRPQSRDELERRTGERMKQVFGDS